MKVYRFKIRQGTLHVTARNKKHAEFQKRAFERDAQRYWIRQQTEVKPNVFALGWLAKKQLGMEVLFG